MSKRSRTPSPSTYSRSSIPDSITPSERSKIIHRDSVPVIEAMHCALPPHRETLSFTSYEDYEVHYQQAHVNRCAECSKNFPTGHFLNLHIEENHDALAAARKARGEKTVSVHCLNFNYCSFSCIYSCVKDANQSFFSLSMAALSRTVNGNAPLRKSDDSI